MVRLPGYGERRIDQLSGGQKQRVALARAVVLEPEVLLLDEPMAALDLKLRKEMQVEVKNLQERLKTTFVFVTHDQDEALIMSDRIAVMNQGRIEQLDTPEALYERPRTRFVADFLAVRNILEATVVSVAGGPGARCGRAGATVLAGRGRRRLRGGRERRRRRAAGAAARLGPGRRTGRRPTPSPARLDDEIYLGDRTDWRVRLGDEIADGGRGRGHGARPPARRRGHGARSRPRRCCGSRTPEPRGSREHAGAQARPRCCSPARSPSLVLFLLPQVLMFEASLGRRSAYGGVVHEWSLANYVRALRAALPRDPRPQRRPGLRHHRRSACSSPTPWPTGSACASPTAGAARLLVLVILPFWTSFLVRMYAWVFVLRTEGLVNLFLGRFGIGAPAPALQRLRGAPGPGLRRAAVHDPAALRVPREARPLAARGRGRPRGAARAHAAARHPAPDRPGNRGRLHPRLHPVARRLPGPRPPRRRAHRLHRQPDPEPVRGGPRHAVRLGALVPALADRARPARACSAGRCARRRRPEAARCARPAALVGLQPPRLPVPVRADPGAGGVLLQQGPAHRELGGLHPRLVREAPAERAGADRAAQQPDRGLRRHRPRHGPRHHGRPRLPPPPLPAAGRARRPGHRAHRGARDRARLVAAAALRRRSASASASSPSSSPTWPSPSPTRWSWCARAWPASTAASRRRPWTWGRGRGAPSGR